MFYKHNYKKEKEEEEEKKEKGKVSLIFQKIKDMDRDDFILVLIPVLLLVILFGSWTNKKAVDIKAPKTMVQSQIVTQQNINKSEEIYLNETAKLNLQNFEVYISKEVPNRGVIFMKASDFIKNNTKIILYDDVKNVKISGNPEILKKLNVSISTSNKINFNTESINIELDHNQKNNSILSVELNTAILDKEQLISDTPLINIRYIESYAD